MQRLQIDPDENLTRKEYLKRKKKEAGKLKRKSKLKYVAITLVVCILSIYVFTQFFIYNRENNFKYIEGEDVSNQKIYNVYYVTEGYTYDPVYSLNSIHSDGFSDKLVYSNSGITNVCVSENYIYGTKEDGLYRIKKDTKDMETLVEKNVLKYKLDGDRIYYINKNDGKLEYYDINSEEIGDLGISNVTELLVDENNIFTVQDEKTKKVLIRYDKNGQDKKVLSGDENVSYIVSSDEKIFFVNKKDGNKIYFLNKDGSQLEKFADISSVYDKGVIKEIDGQKYMFVQGNYLYYINVDDGDNLYRISLETKETEKVISAGVELLNNVDDTVFYKMKGEMGVYLYNFDTKFMAQITKRKLKEFIVDKYDKIEENSKDSSNLSKN